MAGVVGGQNSKPPSTPTETVEVLAERRDGGGGIGYGKSGAALAGVSVSVLRTTSDCIGIEVEVEKGLDPAKAFKTGPVHEAGVTNSATTGLSGGVTGSAGFKTATISVGNDGISASGGATNTFFPSIGLSGQALYCPE